FAGIVWYQGEEDTKYGELYEPLLMALVSLWRTRLGGNIPFSIVQLPKYRDDKNEKWPLVRDAQKRVCEKLPDCALIVSVDTGE
ncbi:sialate O-acetylesterase, partial [uncultured Dubosiella sp.]